MIEAYRQSLVDACIERALELEEDIELVEARTCGRAGSPLIRLVIYRAGGVTVEDCARVNRRLSRELEAVEDLQKTFSIEVSSPGLDRRLHTRRDFEMAVGEVLRVRFNGERGEETIIGLLTEVDDETLLIEPASVARGKREGSQERPRRLVMERIVEGRIEVLL